jgi:hypothetical protein
MPGGQTLPSGWAPRAHCHQAGPQGHIAIRLGPQGTLPAGWAAFSDSYSMAVTSLRIRLADIQDLFQGYNEFYVLYDLFGFAAIEPSDGLDYDRFVH